MKDQHISLKDTRKDKKEKNHGRRGQWYLRKKIQGIYLNGSSPLVKDFAKSTKHGVSHYLKVDL